MTRNIIGIFRQTVMITGFVFVMMLLLEYLNVLTSGVWRRILSSNKWGQYLVAALLGVIPGCLGAFAVVAMYSHGFISLGAVVAAMIATSGDEAFLMLTMIPSQALIISGLLFAIGIIAGALTDFSLGKRGISGKDEYCELELHEDYGTCCSFSAGRTTKVWKNCSLARAVLALLLVLIIAAVVTGHIGPGEWNWIRVTVLIVSAGALFVVSTVTDHFLQEHLWEHIAKRHLPKIFLWAFGTLLLIFILREYLDLGISGYSGWGRWIFLLVACLAGLIPQSGPHLVFLTLYVSGTLPLSILLANSIVQDGHGMLPMLAESRKAFFLVKAVNILVGLLVGAAALSAGL
ncbi:MAG TPA: putative manganese transporter [Candidatus Krumholzibacteriaceae bacterium]|nr:putative manganese transporter [Candidatus Krumholzibacteriaceae bacterium]